MPGAENGDEGWVVRHVEDPFLLRRANGSWMTQTGKTILSDCILSHEEARQVRLNPRGAMFFSRPSHIGFEPVLARIQSSDRMIDKLINISPWIDAAEDIDLVDIMDFNWGDCELADRIVRDLCREGEPACASLIAYIDLQPESANGDQVDFSIEVDRIAADARARSRLSASLQDVSDCVP